jgi:superfamily II DNA or RNA helicase
VSSTTKTRREDIQDFKDGKYPVLVSTLLKEGVDVPSMDAIIFAAGYKSSVLVIQTIGRALRAAKGKKDSTIVDFFDHGHRFLEQHSQMRMNTYAETYGKYFKPKYIRSEDI